MDEHSKYKIFDINDHYFLLSSGPDLISRWLQSGKLWEAEIIALSKLLIEGNCAPVLLDIGANLGAWSVPMGKSIQGVNGRLYAWEPQRQIYHQLCANFLINNLTNCFAFNKAIGDHTGKIDVPVMDVLKDNNLGAVSLIPEVYLIQKKLNLKTMKK